MAHKDKSWINEKRMKSLTKGVNRTSKDMQQFKKLILRFVATDAYDGRG